MRNCLLLLNRVQRETFHFNTTQLNRNMNFIYSYDVLNRINVQRQFVFRRSEGIKQDKVKSRWRWRRWLSVEQKEWRSLSVSAETV
ncbi:hypothetical protein EXN66_Car003753 [Channa argus]|uniref:Uncharacterized protein n=1 Tax=Channa argus TaxID=215402 RepID=A0A6G1PCQ5_CHAAH|nr:hypothetical protein EXN66_Car003753 [Channa argus]